MVCLLGGELKLESPAPIHDAKAGGPGTCYSFTLQFGVQEPEESVPSPPTVTSLAGFEVLVVDDSPDDRQTIMDMLALWDMKPVGVKNAVEAMLVMENSRQAGRMFPLAVIDANMPEIDGFALTEEMRRSDHFAQTRVILLAAAAMKGDGQRCRGLGIAAYLPKPIEQSDLLQAVMTVLGNNTPSANPTLITRHTLHENRKPLRILLAEDNANNLKVVFRILRKWGHHVVGVENGADAVRQVLAQPFDLILMDVDMPEMDGLEATRQIRRDGRFDADLLHIVAMTGSPENQTPALEAGMNGVLCKPIRIDELYVLIKNVAARHAQRTPQPVET